MKELYETSTFKRTPRLYQVVEGEVPLTGGDLMKLYKTFETAGSYIGSENITLPEFIIWINEHKAEVTW